ncbi:MAG: sigma-54-dependent Fis family transcriptional regulator [Myxococcales bacterium]|nr:sigma-54-dependent Fis family transcriptional regulator [Myxococcales bacterium]
MPKVLIVEDDAAVRLALDDAHEPQGIHLVARATFDEANEELSGADLVLTDLVMPGVDGFGVLAASRADDTERPVVMLTAQGSEATAVRAWREGAYGYLRKPFAVEELRLVVSRALEARALRAQAFTSRVERVSGKRIVGESPALLRALGDAKRIGARDVTVLLRGETGTGKELFASVLHAASPRRDGPCVRLNAAALTESLVESELFGHEKGAFTGATSARVGHVQRAHGGTLVLDEIAELTPGTQAKLLRVLQEREVLPLGAQRPVPVDMRLVASTHEDLRRRVAEGRFREDLYFRVAVVEIVVPPLRERREDVPLLVETFRARYAERFDLGAVRFTDGLVAALARRDYPGNVRELENLCASLLARAEPDTELDETALARITGPSAPSESSAPGGGPLREQVAAFEAEAIRRALAETGGNQSAAARLLAVSRMTLLEKMKRYGIPPRG